MVTHRVPVTTDQWSQWSLLDAITKKLELLETVQINLRISSATKPKGEKEVLEEKMPFLKGSEKLRVAYV